MKLKRMISMLLVLVMAISLGVSGAAYAEGEIKIVEEDDIVILDETGTGSESDETNGVSEYTVIFTYGPDAKTYKMPGGATVPLSDIVAAVDLTGEVASVESSDTEYVTVSRDGSGKWFVTAKDVDFRGVRLWVTIGSTHYGIGVHSSAGEYGFINGIPARRDGSIFVNGIQWKVIGKNSDNYLLISEALLGEKLTWSAAKEFCNTVYGEFSAPEKAAVTHTAKTDRRYHTTGPTYGESSVDADLFLMSGEEADTYFGGTRDRLPGSWWLRSPLVNDSYNAGYIDRGGRMNSYGINADTDYNDIPIGARPAFQLDRSAILMESASEGAKSTADAGSGLFGTLNTSTERKLTLIDSSMAGVSVTANSAAAAPGGSLAVSYSGAGTGTGEYVSAILCDPSGEILYYASLTPDSSGSGTWNMAIPAELAKGSYTLKVFSEQQNGDKWTDYASNPVDISLTVDTMYTVTVTAAPTEGGTVSGGGAFVVGSSVTVTATPAAGYRFINWTEDGIEVSANASYTFAAAADRDLTANFEAITYTVTVTDDGNGTASADPDSGIIGTEVTLTATPEAGYQFKEWQVISGGVTITDNKFSIGTEDVEIKAVFELITCTVTVVDYTNGTANCSLASGITGSYGDEFSFTVSCEDDLPVLVALKDGDDYKVLPCATEEGEHRFSFVLTGDAEIALALKGDVDLDGQVMLKDNTMVKRVVIGNYEFKSRLSFPVGDIDSDGELETADATMIARAVIGTYCLEW